MWEYRLAWTQGKPPAWDGVWGKGLEVLAAQGRKVEERPDTYLVVVDRVDAGLKLRGGKEDDFDLKVRHRREGGWELWEKVAFQKWNALEVTRMGVLLHLTPPASGPLEHVTPAKGVAAFLDAVDAQRTRVAVEKTRMQASARDLMSAWPGSRADPASLAELVEMKLPGRPRPVYSLCLEAMAPLPSGGDPVPAAGAVCGGYPELILRHLEKSI